MKPTAQNLEKTLDIIIGGIVVVTLAAIVGSSLSDPTGGWQLFAVMMLVVYVVFPAVVILGIIQITLKYRRRREGRSDTSMPEQPSTLKKTVGYTEKAILIVLGGILLLFIANIFI